MQALGGIAVAIFVVGLAIMGLGAMRRASPNEVERRQTYEAVVEERDALASRLQNEMTQETELGKLMRHLLQDHGAAPVEVLTDDITKLKTLHDRKHAQAEATEAGAGA